MIIRKVWKTKRQRFITLPKYCDILEGDYVIVEKVINVNTVVPNNITVKEAFKVSKEVEQNGKKHKTRI